MDGTRVYLISSVVIDTDFKTDPMIKVLIVGIQNSLEIRTGFLS